MQISMSAKYIRFGVFILFFILVGAHLGLADQEARNRVYVAADEFGQYYAKSVPDADHGLKGTTAIYEVGREEDTLMVRYPWYSPQVYLAGFRGTNTVYVVQMGPWHRGQEASSQDHAIAFYKNDQLLKQYSTLDIVSHPESVLPSVSHYVVFEKVVGFRRPFGDQLIFDIERYDGQMISFDVNTGQIISEFQEKTMKDLYDAEVTIGRLKWAWYEAHKANENANNHILTEAELRQFAPQEFPMIPEGYQYAPDPFWAPVRIQRIVMDRDG